MNRLTIKRATPRRQPEPNRTDQAVRQFARSVAQLPQTWKVLLTRPGGAPRVLTVIDAAPFDRSARDMIYDRQQALLEAFSNVDLDFALVNPLEWPEAERDHLLPENAEVLWQRD